uniref:ORF44g n=1 Tax=Pinus koraiensis TaxID=88728 RepID=Q85WX6_PINKO|nr:ORF44g [Pinus koraiensis]
MSPSGRGKIREKNRISRCPATNPSLSFHSRFKLDGNNTLRPTIH